MQELTQASWNLLMDCHLTDICIRYEPAQLVSAVVFVAAKCLGVVMPEGPQTLSRQWWHALCPHMEEPTLEGMGAEILAVYDGAPGIEPQAERHSDDMEK